MSTAPTISPAPPSPSWLRRSRVPLFAIALPVVMFVVLRLWFVLDLEPAAQMPLFMVFEAALLIGLLTLAIWWLFFSGFHWLTKIVVAAIVVALPFGFAQTVRRVDFMGTMMPRFYFI